MCSTAAEVLFKAEPSRRTARPQVRQLGPSTMFSISAGWRTEDDEASFVAGTKLAVAGRRGARLNIGMGILKMNLNEKIKNISQGPGVYIFKDKDGKVLYVGKAKNLKKRLQQYFLSDSLKIKKLLSAVNDIEVVETENEAMAIFKESDLIKKFDPPFNQLLRDDTRYFYLIFTDEILPKVFITHQPEKFKVKEIIGPFFEGTSLKEILRIIRKEIPFCSCKEKHLRNCLNAELGLCFGWCCLKNAEIDNQKIKAYHQNLNLIKKIFTQDLKSLKKSLLAKIKNLLSKNEMARQARLNARQDSARLAQAQKLKQAFLAIEKLEMNQELIKEENIFIEAETRKILLHLKEIFHLKTFPHLIEVCDISHFAGKEKVGILVSFLNGIYQPQLLKKFKIKTILSPDDPRMIYEVLSRRLKHKEWGIPDIFLIDGGKIQYKMAKKAIDENNLEVSVLALAKPKQEVYYDFDKKISLKDYPLIKNFILSLDRKAHQLVLKYHQKKRESRLKESQKLKGKSKNYNSKFKTFNLDF
jgi:excinuclease ABC subunit C